ncbi:hypothetical protein [Agrobacterium burrii]|uniref:Uncharacterized protein n=1 Tax=Agrobacterium burrii TaxID=2815339 RepID=A0ABS3EGU9_9HYPH|nr:hypothetical protein [Agrobacterium burrii]MBO0131171.1 hypothetical protein [Agrobacterium burrii]
MAPARANAAGSALLNQYLIKIAQPIEETQLSVAANKKALPGNRKGHCSKTG